MTPFAPSFSVTDPDSELPSPRRLPGFPDGPKPASADVESKPDETQRDRLSAPDMFTVAQAAALTQLTEAEVRRLIDAGRALAIAEPSSDQRHPDYRLPYWQFFDPLWSHLPTIKVALRTASPWGLLRFLEQAADGLWGDTPRTAIEQGHVAQVLTYAEWSSC